MGLSRAEMVQQTQQFSCGAAALVSILRTFFRETIDENRVVMLYGHEQIDDAFEAYRKGESTFDEITPSLMLGCTALRAAKVYGCDRQLTAQMGRPLTEQQLLRRLRTTNPGGEKKAFNLEVLRRVSVNALGYRDTKVYKDDWIYPRGHRRSFETLESIAALVKEKSIATILQLPKPVRRAKRQEQDEGQIPHFVLFFGIVNEFVIYGDPGTGAIEDMEINEFIPRLSNDGINHLQVGRRGGAPDPAILRGILKSAVDRRRGLSDRSTGAFRPRR